MRRQGDVMSAVANFNEQIEKIKDEFGFQFNTPHYKLVAETPSFLMYQVLPIKDGVEVRDDLKPVLLVPPYMLGVNILAFLPFENKSYAHAFANEGIPTYVRVVKDIWETEAVQTMTPDDDCTQTEELCRELMAKHGQKVTLNGTCQGGYISLMNILSGTLQNVCDTLISNVTPVDGTYSEAISGMPQLHNNFVLSPMPNGNMVANGYLLSLGMRFVAIDQETPLVTVLNLAKLEEKTKLSPGKTPAALYRWLRKERAHLPPAIAEMSSITFQQPIAEDGTLPVDLYGKPLNLRDFAEMGVKWYQNYAIKDDLVTPSCATAGNKHLEGTDVIETVAFPGGHVAILTSPYSKKAPVNGTFVDAKGKNVRGPVKFQLDVSSGAANPT
jgi:poly(3-hydroxyalkanoate) synthetase